MEEEGMKYARAGIVNQMNYFNRQLINFLMSEIKNEYVDTENRAL